MLPSNVDPNDALPGVDDMDDARGDYDPLDDLRAPELDVGGLEEVEAKWRDYLHVNPDALDDEFVKCPAQIAHLTAVHARILGEHLRAKAQVKRLLGLLRIKARHELVDGGTAKPTESQVDARVEGMGSYQQAQEWEIEAEVAREEAKGRVAAVMAKKDMLVQLGANRRAELERDPVVRDRLQAARAGVAEGAQAR